MSEFAELDAIIAAAEAGEPYPEPEKEVDLSELDALIAYHEEQNRKQEEFLANPKTQAAKQLLHSTARSAAMGVDFIANPLRMGAEALLDTDIPTLADTIAPEDEAPLPDGLLKNVTEGLGMGVSIAPSMVGVAGRSGATVADTVYDLAGFGYSKGTEAMRMAEQTARANVELLDSIALSKRSPEKRAQAIADEINVEANLKNLNRADARRQYNLNLKKKVAKEAEGRPVSPLLKDEVPAIEAANVGKVAQRMQMEGFTPEEAIEGIARNPIKFKRTTEELSELSKPVDTLGGYKPFKKGEWVGWYDRNFLPVAEVLRKYIDPRVGARYEKAIEGGLRQSEQLVARHGEAIAPIVELVNKDRELKGWILDVGEKPELMNKILIRVGAKTGEAGTKAFTAFMRDSLAQNRQAQQKLFKPTRDAKFNEKWYFHTEKGKPKDEFTTPSWMRIGSSDAEKPSALRNKTRKTDLKKKDIDKYENPLLSHMRYMSDQQQMLNMATEFNVRPVLGRNGTSQQFFHELGKGLARGGDKMQQRKGKAAGQIMHNAFMGSRTAPPNYIRAFMSLAYAGTLAQLKSATLNLHDPFVAAFRMGGRNALKSVGKTLKGEFGQTLEEMGLGNQGIGEYVRTFGDTLVDPTKMDMAAQYADTFTKKGMSWSQFARLDRMGKGSVLRTAVNQMRSSAQKGTLAKDFADVATESQLRIIQPHLKAGKKVKDMPQEARDIVTDLAFVALGKQQLISYAGRPLNYLKFPMLRPLYAMTGFAVKQQALLRDMVGSAIREGDYVKAGRIAASYVGYAGLGYAVLDTGRSAVFKGEDVTEEDFAMAIVDQVMGAALMNKLDTGYGLTRFKQDPTEYLMESFLPPKGLVGAAADTVVQGLFYAFTGGEEGELSDELLERAPLIGDIYKYQIKDKD